MNQTLPLFTVDPTVNLLPRDGTVHYLGPVLSLAEAERYYAVLSSGVPWKHDEVIVFGQHVVTARQVAWYGDSPYTYSGTTKQALPWSAEMLELKRLVERLTGSMFNSCLLNLYHHGDEGVSWHSDDEKSLLENAAIASLSFGAERKFSFKHKRTQETVSIVLEQGSLLLMKDATQTHWWHCLPKSRRIKEPRINLTFRSIRSLV